jgi:hypothetical protein
MGQETMLGRTGRESMCDDGVGVASPDVPELT